MGSFAMSSSARLYLRTSLQPDQHGAWFAVGPSVVRHGRNVHRSCVVTCFLVTCGSVEFAFPSLIGGDSCGRRPEDRYTAQKVGEKVDRDIFALRQDYIAWIHIQVVCVLNTVEYGSAH